MAIIVTFVLVIVSIMVLVLYVNHIGRRLRAASLIEAVGHQIRSKLDELYPERMSEEPQSPDVIFAPRSGVLIHIDHKPLVDLARKADVKLDVFPSLATLFRPAHPWYASAGNRGSTLHQTFFAGSRSIRSGRLTRILPMVPDYSSISAYARSPTRSTRQPLCKPSTVSTTSCASSSIGGFRAASTATKPVRCGS